MVIFSSERGKSLEQLRRAKPRDWSGFNQDLVSGKTCPFCIGHEGMTPPEIRVYRKEGTKSNTPDWSVRAFQNLFSAVDYGFPGVLLEERQVGQFLVTEGFGCHYVVVETPEHVSHMADYSPEHLHDVVHMWRDMTNLIAADRNVRYVATFQNFGPSAGMSQPHCHGQFVGLAHIPFRVLNELHGAQRFFQINKDCFYCREIADEIRMGERVIEETPHFLAWCPYTSKTPYQAVVSPKDHQSYFGNISTYHADDRLTEFAGLMQRVTKRIKVALNDPDFNAFLHVAPSSQPELPYYHWHWQIEPLTMAIQAGAERGFNIFINPRSPESAAADLRSAVIV